MSNKSSQDRKFDTLRLLEGVPRNEEYKAEDIMREFSSPEPEPVSQQTMVLREIPLDPPPKPTVREPSSPDAFFHAPPEIDALGEDFWDAPTEEPEDIWAEIEDMGRGARRKSHRRTPPEPSKPAPIAAAVPLQSKQKPAGPAPGPAFAAEEAAEQKERPRRNKAKSTQPEPEQPKPHSQRRQLREAEARTPRPDIAPEKVVKHYRQRAQSARRRIPLLLILSLVALYFTLAGSFGWPAPERPLLCRLLAIFTIVGALLSYDLLIQTLYDLVHLRFRASTLVLVSTAISVVDAFLSATEGVHIPFCVLSLLGWLGCLWGAYYQSLAMRRTAKALQQGCGNYAVRSAQEHWNGTDCIVKTEGDTSGFLHDAEATDYAAQLMQLYVPIACIGSLLLALVLFLFREADLLQSLAALLTAATPLAAALCFARPFSLLSRRLYKHQSAIGGWVGAERLGGYQAVVLRDEDLFPAGTVSMNGAKFFEEYDKNYVISCTATVFNEAGGDLQPVFHRLAQDFRANTGLMTSYRAYEGGGYGANIGKDIILVGTVSFMRLMGIPIPDGSNIRQAVYVAINNQLAAIFSINYAPSRGTRNGLDALCSQRRLVNLFATRDFILNPSLLRQRFRLSGGRLEFPPVEERMRLSTENAGLEGQRAGLMRRDSFSDYSDIVAGGRNLYNLTRVSSIFALFTGVIGMVLIFFLSYLGSALSATVTNLLLYSVLWALPPILITSWVDKY